MKRNKIILSILFLLVVIISFGISACKGYRTQKPGGKDRTQKFSFSEKGAEVPEESSASAFSEVDAISGNFEVREFASCTSASNPADCEYKAYVRFSTFKEPIKFNPLFLGVFEKQKVATNDHGPTILYGPYIPGVEGKAYSKQLMDDVKSQSKGMYVPGRKDGLGKGINLYDPQKSLAKIEYDPNSTNQRNFIFNMNGVLVYAQANMPSISAPMGESFIAGKVLKAEQDKELKLTWTGNPEGGIVRGVCECSVKKVPYILEINAFDDGELVLPPKQEDGKDGAINFLPECTAECQLCRIAPQTVTTSDGKMKINGFGKKCSEFVVTKTKPKKT